MHFILFIGTLVLTMGQTITTQVDRDLLIKLTEEGQHAHVTPPVGHLAAIESFGQTGDPPRDSSNQEAHMQTEAVPAQTGHSKWHDGLREEGALVGRLLSSQETVDSPLPQHSDDNAIRKESSPNTERGPKDSQTTDRKWSKSSDQSADLKPSKQDSPDRKDEGRPDSKEHPLPSKESPFVSMFGKDGLRNFLRPFLFGSSKTQGLQVGKGDEVQLNKSYQTTDGEVRFTVKESLGEGEFYAVRFSGTGQAKVRLDTTRLTKDWPTSAQVAFNSLDREVLMPLGRDRFGEPGDSFTLSNTFALLFDDWSFEVTKMTEVAVQFEQSVKVLSSFVSTVHIAARRANGTVEDTRTQMVVQSSLDRQRLTGHESLDMLVNFNKTGFPTAASFDFKASGSLGNGLIKTLRKTNPFFCSTVPCQYSVSVVTEGVKELVFYVAELANNATLAFNESLVMTEEIEPGEHLTYRVEIPQHDDDIMFRLRPAEGRTTMFVNPDVAPSSLAAYQYYISSVRPEEILVTSHEADTFGWGKQVFYVSFEAFEPNTTCSFKFEVSRLPRHVPVPLEQDTTQTGIVTVDEVISFVADFENFSSEMEDSLDVQVSLSAISGEAHLYVKECLPSDSQCRVTREDIDGWEGLASNKKRLLKRLADRSKDFAVVRSRELGMEVLTGSVALQFNCQPFFEQIESRLFDPLGLLARKKRHPTNDFHVSQTCQFAVGVQAFEVNGTQSCYYNLTVSGNTVHKRLFLNEPTDVRLTPDSVEYFKVSLSPQDMKDYSGLQIRVTTVEGSFSAFFSTDYKYPNRTNSFDSIVVDDEHFSTLQTVQNVTVFNFRRFNDSQAPSADEGGQPVRQLQFAVTKTGGIRRTDGLEEGGGVRRESKFFGSSERNLRHLYVGVHSDKYSILELYVEPIVREDATAGHAETLVPAKMVHRTLDVFSQKVVGLNDSVTYFTNFAFRHRINANGTHAHSRNRLKLTLNSNARLTLCVQVGTDEYQVHKHCDFTSDTDSLTLKTSQYDFVNLQKVVVSVQRRVGAEDSSFISAAFTLVANIGGDDLSVEVPFLGRTMVATIDSHLAMFFRVDLRRASSSMALLFESEGSFAHASLAIQLPQGWTPMGSLDHGTFALEVEDVNVFCNTYFDKSADCYLYVYVSSESRSTSRFSLTCVADRGPILVKDGDFLSIPTTHNQHFLFESPSPEGVTFSTFAPSTEGIVYSAKVASAKTAAKELTESFFAVKSSLATHSEVVWGARDLSGGSGQLLGFLYAPKLSKKKAKQEREKGSRMLFHDHRARVSIRTSAATLVPFVENVQTCMAGFTDFYHVAVENADKFSVMLSMLAGKAELFVGEGKSSFVDAKHYLLRRKCKTGEEVEFDKTVLQKRRDESRAYTLGVFCRTPAKYSLIYLPDFQGMIKVRAQKLVDLSLKASRVYYLDFESNDPGFHSLFHSLNGEVTVQHLRPQPSQSPHSLEALSDDGNWVTDTVFRKGSVPVKDFLSRAASKSKHLILKLLTGSEDTRVNLAFYRPKEPLLIPTGHKVTFALGPDDAVTFVAHLTDDYESAEFDFKLESGAVQFHIGSSLSRLTDEGDNKDSHFRLKGSGHRFALYKPRVPAESTSDIVIFRTVYVRVESSEASTFTLLLKPRDMMRELRANEPELVRMCPDQDLYLYYRFDPAKMSHVKKIEIKVLSVKSYAFQPLFLFNPSEEIIFHETPFYPMEVQDIKEFSDEEFVHVSVLPELRDGNYVVKLFRHPMAIPVKVTVSINDQHVVAPNSFTKNYLPTQSDSPSQEFNVHLPSKGEFRVVVESCEDIELVDSKFYGRDDKEAGQKVDFQDNLVTGFNYLSVTSPDQEGNLRQVKEVVYPVRRFVVKQPGLLHFRVVSSRSRTALSSVKLTPYMVLTEFLKEKNDLVLKDLVTVVNPANALDRYVTGHRYVGVRGDLEVSTKFPSFKPQLKTDYPEVTRLQISLVFSLMAAEHFGESLSKCGLSALEMYQTVVRKVTRSFKVSETDTSLMPIYAEVLFTAAELDSLGDRNTKKVVFSYAVVQLIENDDDQADLTLDQKLTYVPYFLMELTRRPKVSTHLIMYCVLGLGVVLLVTLACGRCCRKPKEDSSSKKTGYESAKEGVWASENRLEMSSTDQWSRVNSG